MGIGADGRMPFHLALGNFAGQVDPCLSETFSFDEIGHAHQLMHENRHPHGNMACLVNAVEKGRGAS